MKFVFSVVISWLMKFVLSAVRSFYGHTVTAAVTQATCMRSFSSSCRSKPYPLKDKSRKTARSPTRKTTEEAMAVVMAATSLPLTEQQSQVLNAVAAGDSMFITGSAGTGKTILLRHVIEVLTHIHGSKHVFVTASTGVAACALNGMTLHSFAGVGLGTADRETLLLNVMSKKGTFRRWKRAKALVIDEVSMVNADLFDHLEYIARRIRLGHKNRVWGGIQLIVCGDFFQLPPVTSCSSNSGKEFAFEAECWNASFDKQIELTQIFRQSDSQLIKLLQGIRRGFNDREHLQLLNTRLVESEPDPLVIRLFPRKQDVKGVNDERLRSLGHEIYTYTAWDIGQDPWKNQLKLGIAPDELELCLGARVMLLKNLDPRCGLVNGATGTILGFEKAKEVSVMDISGSGLAPIVEFDSGPKMVIYPERWDVTEGETVFATRMQLPLILAWALSIHKCQGMTLDCLHTDLSRAFGCGMVYVALSRVRSLDGLYLSGFKSSKIKAHPKVLEFYQNLFGSQP